MLSFGNSVNLKCGKKIFHIKYEDKRNWLNERREREIKRKKSMQLTRNIKNIIKTKKKIHP